MRNHSYGFQDVFLGGLCGVCPYSPKCVEDEFSEVRIQYFAYLFTKTSRVTAWLRGYRVFYVGMKAIALMTCIAVVLALGMMVVRGLPEYPPAPSGPEWRDLPTLCEQVKKYEPNQPLREHICHPSQKHNASREKASIHQLPRI